MMTVNSAFPQHKKQKTILVIPEFCKYIYFYTLSRLENHLPQTESIQDSFIVGICHRRPCPCLGPCLYPGHLLRLLLCRDLCLFLLRP